MFYGTYYRYREKEPDRQQPEKASQKLKISQQQLSDKLELYGVYVCRGSVSRIEDYSRTVTDIELYAIAEALGVEIGALIQQRADPF